MNIKNRSAYYEYHILEELVAGIQLFGSEVKSIRNGEASLKDAYIYINNNEVFIKNMYIRTYKESSYLNHEELRDRKLLLNKSEISNLLRATKDMGITIIPIELFTVRNLFKLKISIARGKKLYDKRASIKDRDLKREKDRNL